MAFSTRSFLHFGLVLALICPPASAVEPVTCRALIVASQPIPSNDASRAAGIVALANEVSKLKREISSSLNQSRVEATAERVGVAREWVVSSTDRALKDIAFAQSQLEQISACKLSGKLGWMGRAAACGYWWTNKAASHLAYYLVPVVISYTSELVGLDSAGIEAMAKARAEVMAEIDSAREELRLAQVNADAHGEYKAKLSLTGLGIYKWTAPYLAGVTAQIKRLWSASGEWFSRAPASEDEKVLAAASRADFVSSMGTHLGDAFRSFNFQQMRSNPYLVFDYLYRFTIVSVSNVVINFIRSIPNLSSLATAPWHLIPNAGTMMALQSEMAARNTTVRTGVEPAKDMNELLARMPGVIAGDTGFLHQGWGRLSTFLTAIPLEFPVLTGWTFLYMAMTGAIDPFTTSGLMQAGAGAANFVSLFGLYLIVKWAVWDKPVELGLIPELRGLASHEYEKQVVTLAKQQGIPVETVELVNPETGKTVQGEQVAWKPSWLGGMWKQWALCFVPEGTKGVVSYKEFFKYLLSGGWKSRLVEFKKDYAKFRAFYESPDMIRLQESQLAQRVRRQQKWEFLYRTGNSLWDTLVAIVLAGGGSAPPPPTAK